MSDKATYEALEQRIAELEAQIRTTEASEQELQKLRFAIEGAPVAIGMSDTEGRHYYQNKAFTELFGYQSAEELQALGGGKHVCVDPAIAQEKFARIMAGNSWFGEHQMRTKDGRTLTVKEHADAIKDATGQIISLIGIINDVTDKKHAEQDRKKSEAKYLQLIETASDAIYLVSALGKFIDVNAAACQMLGRNKKDILGSEISYIDPNFSIEAFFAFWEETPIDEPKLFETTHLHKNGTLIPIEVSGQKFQIEDEVLFFGVARDITERKKAEQLRIQSEEKYRHLIETASDAIYLISVQGTFVDVNAAACKMLNRTKTEILELGINDIDPNFSLEAFLEFWKVTPLDEPRLFETTHLHKNGSLIPVEVSGQKFKIENDVFFFGVARNISERKQAEYRLIESEEKYRLLHENAGLGIGYWSPEGTVISFNRIAAALMNEEPESFIGKSAVELFGEELGLEYLRRITMTAETRETKNYEDTVSLPAGEKTYISTYTPVRNEQDEVLGVQIISSDVTAGKQTEKELAESEERYRITLKALNEGLYDWDIENNQLVFSPSYFTMLGYEPDAFKPTFESFQNLLHPDDREKVMEALKHSVSQNEPPTVGIDFRMKAKDGSYRWINSRGRIVKSDSTGKPLRMVGTNRDITHRKLSEAKLVEKKQEAERYLNLAGIMFIGLDKHGTVNVANKKACEILECEESEIIGRKWFEHFIPERMRHEVHNVFTQLMKGDVELVEYYENPVITATGREKQIAWHNTYITDGNDQITGILSSGEDISEKLHLKAQLIQAQKMESIGNLAGGIAHDFNNILSSVIGFTELSLDEVAKGSSLEDNLQEVYSAGKRAKELVSQILTFARQSEKELQPLRPSDVVFEALKFIRSSLPVTIEIKDTIDSDSYVIANPTQIYQMIINLCTNAAHAMADQGGVLELRMKDINVTPNSTPHKSELKNGSYLEIQVSDTGAGIAPELLRSIFEPYFTTKRPGEGTGMGLAVVQGIVEASGGKIFVKSSPGKGALFSAYLPLTEERPPRALTEVETLPTGSERVIFVDDEVPIAKMGTRILSQLGYSVTTITSSIEALELFKSNPYDFDLVISDVTMPKMTGDKMAAEMMSVRADIPVILCTGYSARVSDLNAAELGIKALATKPIVKAELAKTVRKVLDEAKG
ncbi:MAG: PAS domain S-box protein [Desulfobulbaceae bacterium]|nr:MAG: PAS domain S-box protein [Desulfobulbaceae bacterium]